MALSSNSLPHNGLPFVSIEYSNSSLATSIALMAKRVERGRSKWAAASALSNATSSDIYGSSNGWAISRSPLIVCNNNRAAESVRTKDNGLDMREAKATLRADQIQSCRRMQKMPKESTFLTQCATSPTLHPPFSYYSSE
jgi:hypothetical protein